MMTQRERADKLRDALYRRSSVDDELNTIERYLDEACDEAVQADRRLAEKNKEALDEAIARAGASPRPTVEDALKGRDKLWCEALIATGDTRIIEAVTKQFNDRQDKVDPINSKETP